jgi:membrane protein DedA with SNARE-associated domain
MEAGVPIPVPNDLVMLLLGERVSAGESQLRVRAGRALLALVLGSSLFLQAHLLLGYALGPAARELLDQARLRVLVVAAVILAATATLLPRRHRPRVTRVLAEGACPACLALGLVGASTHPGPT